MLIKEILTKKYKNNMNYSGYIDEIKRWGFRRFLYAAIMWRMDSWFRIACVFARKLHEEAITVELAEGRSVRIASYDELLEAAKDPVLRLVPSSIQEALQRGEFCTAVFDGDKIIAYAWRATGTTPHVEGVAVVFEKPYRYGFDSFTHPEYRQQKLQNAIAYVTDPAFIKEGYTHAISFVETHNYPSLISSLSRSNIVVGYAAYLILFGKFFSFRSRGVKEIGFGFVKSP